MRSVIALSGKRCSGKDTLARFVVESASAGNQGVICFAFAEEAKRSFARQWNATHSSTDSIVNGELLITDRAYKERWRTNLTAFVSSALAADPAVFCRQVVQLIVQSPLSAIIVITDLRLKEELDELSKHFRLCTVRIERSDENRRASGWTYVKEIDSHYTETDLDGVSTWSAVVRNDSTLANLSDQAHVVLEKYRSVS